MLRVFSELTHRIFFIYFFKIVNQHFAYSKKHISQHSLNMILLRAFYELSFFYYFARKSNNYPHTYFLLFKFNLNKNIQRAYFKMLREEIVYILLYDI